MRVGRDFGRGRCLDLGRMSPRLVGGVSMALEKDWDRMPSVEIEARDSRWTHLRGRQLEECHGRRWAPFHGATRSCLSIKCG